MQSWQKDFTKDPTCIFALCMEGNATDTSRSKYNGTVVNATLTTGKWGKANTAYSFDGTGDYIKLTDTVVPIGTKTVYTVLVTYKTTSTSEDSLYTEDDGQSSGDSFFQIATDNGVAYSVTYENNAQKGNALVYTSASVNDGNWHTIAVVKASTTNYKMYFDGSEVDAETASQTGTTDCAYTAIAAHRNVSIYDEDWSGQISQVAVFSRVLTSTELTQIHTYGLKGNKT
jgi:hypothetical protein